MNSLAGKRGVPARWARRLAAFALVLLSVAGASHRYGLLETVVFFWILALVACLATVGLCLSALALRRFWLWGDPVGRDAALALFVSLVVAAPFVVSTYRVYALPRLHDISTDLADPPAMPLAAAQRGAAMNRVEAIDADSAAMQEEAYPEIIGRRYNAPADRVLESVVAVITSEGWDLRAAREPGVDGETVVEAMAGSPILNLPADVAVRIIDEETTSYVDMRSSSRYGLHDFGDNAARIARFLLALDAIVARQAGVPAQAD